MLSPKQVYDWLADREVDFYAGVPDSLLKDLCAYITNTSDDAHHVITANEGSAIAMAMGYFLATNRIGAVYFQNSGLGNTVNPITSLADPAIYGVPMILIVGWRGEPGRKDEPQHVTMGEVTLPTLDALGVPYSILPEEPDAAEAILTTAVDDARRRSAPHAIVVRKGTFEKYTLPEQAARYSMTREQAIGLVTEALPLDAAIVSTTGKPSRELFELREARNQPHDSDLLIVGGMGHASQIALGVAVSQPTRTVYCFDGDGAVLMHMGGLSTIGTMAPKNYRHLVLNNGAHDSVGGQPTVGFDVDLCAVARACGYQSAVMVDDEESLKHELAKFHQSEGPSLLEVRVQKGARADLGRPTMTPADLKGAFMKFLA